MKNKIAYEKLTEFERELYNSMLGYSPIIDDDYTYIKKVAHTLKYIARKEDAPTSNVTIFTE